jgi:hypothetical protein
MAQLVAFGEKVHVPSPLQLSVVHPSPSSQVYDVPPQVPAVHTSLFVHVLPSLHGVSFGLFGLLHTPVAGMHSPASWHWSLAVHTTGACPTHVPASQKSACVHRSPSSQLVPSPIGGLLQRPVAESQSPGTWHRSLAPQTIGFPPTHAPPRQVSACVHRLPSSQLAPFALAGFEHTPVDESQVPTAWH